MGEEVKCIKHLMYIRCNDFLKTHSSLCASIEQISLQSVSKVGVLHMSHQVAYI